MKKRSGLERQTGSNPRSPRRATAISSPRHSRCKSEKFQSSIAPKSDRNIPRLQGYSRLSSSNPRSPRRATAIGLNHTRTSQTKSSNPRSPRRATAINMTRFAGVDPGRSNPRSPRRATAISPDSNNPQTSWFQSSIAPKSDRNGGLCVSSTSAAGFQSSIAPKSDRNARLAHDSEDGRTVPILDRPEERPQWRSCLGERPYVGSNPRSPRRATAIISHLRHLLGCQFQSSIAPKSDRNCSQFC